MLPSDEGKDLPPKIRAEDSDKWLAGVLAPGSFPMQYYDDFQSVPPERFAPKRFSIMLASGIPQPEANSYLLNPNGKAGILIPVSRANTYSRQEGLGEVLGNNTAFGVRMVWNEQPGTGSGSNIRMVKAAGRGRTGYILVLPGTMSGNAVVAATDAAGKILWSWHLWVTTYSPDTNQGWMDRHLGAMANSKEAGSAAFGLLYQWGRKDPFPSTSAGLY
ncbi:hypothetical protein [Alistipes provencensis]|uniref:hypothetical protein n=1 Tax=Alistipes provencensis TaxID=1816676 RepID=UPI000AB0BAA7|nr:hypothetical protein [Alistipes provencensis]